MYGVKKGEENMNSKNDYLMEIFKERYTCKGYDPKKEVSDEDFNTIMEVARISPSSNGFEPWKFIRLKNREIIEELRPHAWGAINAFNGASHIVLILAKTEKEVRPGSDYLERIYTEIQEYPEELLNQRREKYDQFYYKDFNLGESERAAFDWTSKQCYIPLANMLTAAAVLGIDSTPIEGFHQEKVHEILTKHKVYDPKEYKIAIMIAFGYTNKDHREKKRRSESEVWETVE